MQILLRKIVTREEFLKSFGRFVILAVLTLTTGLLMARRSIRRDRSLCSAGRACRFCRRLDGCTSPEAVQLKIKMKEKTDGQTPQE